MKDFKSFDKKRYEILREAIELTNYSVCGWPVAAGVENLAKALYPLPIDRSSYVVVVQVLTDELEWELELNAGSIREGKKLVDMFKSFRLHNATLIQLSRWNDHVIY